MAAFVPQSFQIRDRRLLTIRNPIESEAESLLTLSNAILQETEYQIKKPDELRLTKEDERFWIDRAIRNPDDLLLVAEFEKRLVGVLDFHGQDLKRLSHTGYFGISVAKEFRDIGVGRALIFCLLDWAKDHPNIEKINLSVLASNERARGLYTSMGFYEEGRRLDQIKLASGFYVDEILMGRFVKSSLR